LGNSVADISLIEKYYSTVSMKGKELNKDHPKVNRCNEY